MIDGLWGGPETHKRSQRHLHPYSFAGLMCIHTHIYIFSFLIMFFPLLIVIGNAKWIFFY